jgi:hypothetical protein
VWKRRADLPFPRSDFHIVNDNNGLAYITGGCSTRNLEIGKQQGIYSCVPTPLIWTYSAKADTYLNLTSAAVPRIRHSAAILNNKLIIFTGRLEDDSLAGDTEIFDLTTKTCELIVNDSD